MSDNSNIDTIIKNLSKLGKLEIYYNFDNESSRFMCKIIGICAKINNYSCIAHYPSGHGVTAEMALKRLWGEMLAYPIFETEDRYNPKRIFTLIGNNLYEQVNPTPEPKP